MSDSTTEQPDVDRFEPDQPEIRRDTDAESPVEPASRDAVDAAVAGSGEAADTDDSGDTDGTDDSGDSGDTDDTGDSGDTDDTGMTVPSPDRASDQAADKASAPGADLERLENEGDIAADYLEELLDIADLDGDLDMDVEGDRAAVSIVGADLRQLVGRNGEVLEALQELTRLAVYRETGERSRLMLDVGGFRADRRARLEKLAAEVVEEVQATGQRRSLDPMTPFERKVVHDVVAAAGAVSESEGQEPRRYVVILPA